MRTYINESEATNSKLEHVYFSLSQKHDYVQNNAVKFFLSFFASGLINNSGYVMVGTAAQAIAHHFGMDNFMSAFNFSLIAFSIFIVALNAKLMLGVPHNRRMIVILSIQAVSFAIISVTTSVNHMWAFYLALFGSTICGCTTSLGEVNMLGYTKGFPPELVGAWGSGTGLAGPFGSGVYLALVGLGVREIFIFLSLIPCLFIYWVAFSWLDYQRVILSPAQDTTQSSDDQQLVESRVDNNGTDNVAMSYKTAKKVLLKYSGWLSLNLALVYFFEYSCIICWADRANPKTENEGFLRDNAFAILNFCYQIGVFISRSTLKLWKVKRVGIITLIQAVLTSFWVYIAATKSVPLEYQIGLMFSVGLMGGTSYVNIAYQILSSDEIPHTMKELALNINNICINIGITCATLVAMVVDNFIL